MNLDNKDKQAYETIKLDRANQKYKLEQRIERMKKRPTKSDLIKLLKNPETIKELEERLYEMYFWDSISS